MSIKPTYTKTCMGFIQLPLMGWGMLILGTIILILGVSLKIQSSRLHAEKEAHESTRLQYRTFVSEVKRQGEEQEAKVKKEKARQQQVNKERAKTYEKRIADIASAYQRLLSESPHSGSGSVSSIPDPARSPHDSTRDQQLLSVLRHAEEQTARLEELQKWAREQGKP